MTEEKKNYGKVQLAPVSHVVAETNYPGETLKFIGDGELDGNKVTAHAYPREDFLGRPFLLVRIGNDQEDFGCLHINPYRTDKNKAPQLVGRACVGRTMLRMIAWQNEDYRGVPTLAISFQLWEEYQKEAEEYRQSRQPSLPEMEAVHYSMGNDNRTDLPF